MSGAQTIHAGASLGLPAPWTDQTGTALRRPDGTVQQLKALEHKFRVIENFNTRTGKTVTLSSATEDLTNKIFVRGYRNTLTYSGTGTGNAYTELSFSGSVYPYKLDMDMGIYVAVYVHSVNANSVLVVMPSTNFSTNNNSWSASIGSLEPGFQVIAVGNYEYTPYGTDAAPGPYNKLRIYARQSSGAASSVTDFTVLGVFQARRRKARIVLGFDDAYLGGYTYALPRLQARGMVGQIWCDGREFGTTWEGNPVMSAAQARECQAAGWDIGVQAHGRHDILGTEAAITADVAAAKASLVAAGINVSAMYAYDGGQRSGTPANSYAGLTANGFTHARLTTPAQLVTLGEEIAPGYHLNRQAWPGVGVAQTQWGNGTVASQIERAILYGTDIISYTHEIEATAVIGGRESTDMTLAQFDEFLAFIDSYRNAGVLEVVTMTELAATAPQSTDFYIR